MLKELKDVIEAIGSLVAKIGPGWTVVLFGLLFGYTWHKDKRREKVERSIADEKENQIQRLADDNRWMRQVLMEKVMGFSADETKKMMMEGQPTPLLSGRKDKP